MAKYIVYDMVEDDFMEFHSREDIEEFLMWNWQFEPPSDEIFDLSKLPFNQLEKFLEGMGYYIVPQSQHGTTSF